MCCDISVKENEFTLQLENSLPEYQVKEKSYAHGIGLENVKRRLDLLYPNKYQLKLEHGDTYFVLLRLTLLENNRSEEQITTQQNELYHH